MNVSRRSIFATLGLIVAMVLALATYGRVRFGSLPGALAYARGERLFMEPRVRALGALPSDSEHSTSFALTNWTGRSVQLVGSTSSCSCAMVDELPSRLEPF